MRRQVCAVPDGTTLGDVLRSLPPADDGSDAVDMDDLVFEYDGCGSHAFTLYYEDGRPASPPTPPPVSYTDEPGDREAGF